MLVTLRASRVKIHLARVTFFCLLSVTVDTQYKLRNLNDAYAKLWRANKVFIYEGF